MRQSYFTHVVKRHDSLEMTIKLGKVEGSQKREMPSMRWLVSKKKATAFSLQSSSGIRIAYFGGL